jgi:hypothetical protein
MTLSLERSDAEFSWDGVHSTSAIWEWHPRRSGQELPLPLMPEHTAAASQVMSPVPHGVVD